jgi:2-methylaconitate cis-trans-isomerase PrpF
MGVKTLVFWDRVYLDGELIEDTRDYIAQDKEGNVWYFGENVDNYAGGVLTDHHGAWIGGVDGGVPGIWMPADPYVGQEYRQEFYKDAKDMGRVDGIRVSATTLLGTYNDCVKVYEWTPLEDVTAYKIPLLRSWRNSA